MSKVEEFENKIAEFFGAPYAIGVDSATHGIELCLRHSIATEPYPLQEYGMLIVPRHTYISIPFLAEKVGFKNGINWVDFKWSEYYTVFGNICDAAPMWRKDSYRAGSMMCVSFQFSKHLSIGRAGVILLDDPDKVDGLKKMSYDGRLPNVPWRDQDIDTKGYHYYLQPELAQIGLDKLQEAIDRPAKVWSWKDYPDISKFKVFQ